MMMMMIIMVMIVMMLVLVMKLKIVTLTMMRQGGVRGDEGRPAGRRGAARGGGRLRGDHDQPGQDGQVMNNSG